MYVMYRCRIPVSCGLVLISCTSSATSLSASLIACKMRDTSVSFSCRLEAHKSGIGDIGRSCDSSEECRPSLVGILS
jgi:hypothetical protein